MRIYQTLYDAVNETARDLSVRGITVEVNSFQDKKLQGEDRFFKELVGVAFKVDKPLLHRDDVIGYIFRDPEEKKRIIKYCKQEIKDRCSGKKLNPGNSYKIRADLWNNFLEGSGKFSYQYAERLWTNNQFEHVIDTLKNDKGTRQAYLSVWDPNIDMDGTKTGGVSRIPCSLGYQFLIRNDRLHCIYNMRSNDFLSHNCIDLYCCSGLMEYVVKRLKDTYPKLKVGSLTFIAGSLHETPWQLKEYVWF